MRFVVVYLLVATPAIAEQQPTMTTDRAFLFLTQQVLNASAICSNESQELQRQLVEARKQIEELKKPKDESK